MAQTEGKKPVVPIVIGVIVVAAIAAAAFILLTPKKQVSVPSVRYLYQPQAEKALAEVGLKLGEVKEEQNTESYEGLILSQSPEKGQTVDEGSTVDVTVAKGLPIPTEAVVPDLKGMTTEEAEEALINAFIWPLVEGTTYSDDIEPGRVCAQSTAAGTSIPISVEDFQNGEWPHVSYTTSLGKETVKVPDVVGKKQQEARDAFKAAGLGVDTTSSYSDTVEQDRVISQSVAKDVEVPKGTVVTLEISAGKRPVNRVNVPDIRNYSLDEARRSLESAKFNYTYTGDENGRVITVSPAPGTEVDEGSTVRFTLQRTAEQIREEQQRQEEERQRQQEEERQRQQQEEEERQRQEEEERQRQEEEERQRQEQEQQQEQEPEVQYISEADAAESARAAINPIVEDDEILDTTVERVIGGGDAPRYIVRFTTEEAGYEVKLDAITGDIWEVNIL